MRLELGVMAATEALLQNAIVTSQDEDRLLELAVTARLVGARCLLSDPAIVCEACGGYRWGSPPQGYPAEDRPQPCSCT